MRDFYHVYEGNPELLALAMEIGWTQNVVILEADLNTEERRWYLCAVKQFSWSKAELRQKIESQAHQEVYVDVVDNRCYTEYESIVMEALVKNSGLEEKFIMEWADISTEEINNAG